MTMADECDDNDVMKAMMAVKGGECNDVDCNGGQS